MSDSDISKNPPAKAGGRSKKGGSDSPAPWRAFDQSRGGRGLIEGLLSTAHRRVRHSISPQLIIESLPYSVAPTSPPSAEYGRDEIRITVKELEPLKGSFKDLNQRIQKIGYKLIKNRYGWYWLRRV